MKKVRLFLLLLIITLLYGCGENGGGAEQPAFVKAGRSELRIPVKLKCSLDGGWQEAEGLIEIRDELITAYEEELVPVTWEEELSKTEWDEDIRPYMEYDWLQYADIYKEYTEKSYVRMQLMDLNMDGQREMLLLQSVDGCDSVSVYTVENGRVVYCGLIPADGPEKPYNRHCSFYNLMMDSERETHTADRIEGSGNLEGGFWDFWPDSNIDVYQNREGKFKYISGVCLPEWFEIYESTFDGKEITCELLCRVKPDLIYRNSKWEYLTAENDKSPEIDDRTLTKLNGLLAEHMEGYEKVRIPSVSSDYAFPVLEHSEDRTTEEWERVKHNRILTGGMRGSLDKEERQSEIIRNNIRAGFIRAMEGIVTDGESVVAPGEDLKEFYDSYPGEVLWSESTPTQVVTSMEIEGGGYRNIYFLNYDDIGFNMIGYNQQNGDTSENHLYVFTIDLYTPRFSTSKGIRVGMSADELLKTYKELDVECTDAEYVELVGERYVYTYKKRYIYSYKKDSLEIDFYVEEGKISSIRLHRTDLFNRAVKETEDS